MADPGRTSGISGIMATLGRRRRRVASVPEGDSLHDDAAGTTAPTLVLAVGHLHALLGSAVARAIARERTGHFLVVTSYLAHNVVECIIDIGAGFGRRLDEFAAKGPCQGFTLYPHTSAQWTGIESYATRHTLF